MAKYHQVMLSMLVRVNDDADPTEAADVLAKEVEVALGENTFNPKFVRAEAVSTETFEPDEDPGEVGFGDDGDGEEEEGDDASAPPSPEQFNQLTPGQAEQLMVQGIAMQVGQTLGMLSQLPGPFIEQLAVATAREQLQIAAEILPTILDPNAAAEAPTLLLRVFEPKDRNVQVTMKAPKRLDDIRELSVAAQSATLLAFLLSPEARAVLKAYGFSYQFAQSREAPPGKIVLAH